jgi:hypothetical protein
MWWLPLLLLVALLVMTSVERFTETQGASATTIGQAQSSLGAGYFANVNRPTPAPVSGKPDANYTLWASKIAANTPFGTDVAPYIVAIDEFYDKVYAPASTRPTEADVDRFVTTAYPGTDPVSLKTILMEAFHIDSATHKNESAQTAFEPSAVLLAPNDGVDEVRVRGEDEYTPEDTTGPFDESELGTLAATPQTTPTREAPVTSYVNRSQRELTPVENI